MIAAQPGWPALANAAHMPAIMMAITIRYTTSNAIIPCKIASIFRTLTFETLGDCHEIHSVGVLVYWPWTARSTKYGRRCRYSGIPRSRSHDSPPDSTCQRQLLHRGPGLLALRRSHLPDDPGDPLR